MSRRTTTMSAVLDRSSGRSITRRTDAIAAGAAVLAVVGLATVRLAVNAPMGIPDPIADAYGLVETAALVVPAAAALVLGVREREPVARIGLLTVGVFGGLAAVSTAARVPAAGALVAAAVLITAQRTRRPVAWAEASRGTVAAMILLGMGVSLASTTGLVEGPARTAGAIATMAGLAASPVFVRANRSAWLIGGAVLVGTIAAGVGAPFVTGAVTLVVFSTVGVPLLILAVGLAGGVTTLVAALSSGRWLGAAGVGCLLTAGVPATVPRALAVVLGLALLLREGLDG